MTDQLRADPSPGAPLGLSRHLVYHKQRLILHSSIFSAASHCTPPRDNMSHGGHAKTGQWALARKKTGGSRRSFRLQTMGLIIRPLQPSEAATTHPNYAFQQPGYR